VIQDHALSLGVTQEPAGTGRNRTHEGKVVLVHCRIFEYPHHVAKNQLIGITLLAGGELPAVFQCLVIGLGEQFDVEPMGGKSGLPERWERIQAVRLWKVYLHALGIRTPVRFREFDFDLVPPPVVQAVQVSFTTGNRPGV